MSLRSNHSIPEEGLEILTEKRNLFLPRAIKPPFTRCAHVAHTFTRSTGAVYIQGVLTDSLAVTAMTDRFSNMRGRPDGRPNRRRTEAAFSSPWGAFGEYSFYFRLHASYYNCG